MSFLIGLFAGLFGGLVGLGGGVIIITLVVRLFKFSQHQAHGTSLMVLVFTGLAGAATYYLNGSVDFLAAGLLAASAIFTARWGALYANALPEWQLKRAFGIFLICVSFLLLSKPYLAHLAFLSQAAAGWHKVAALLASGALAGFLAGMMGVGGGSLMVPAMVLLVGDSQYTAQGSSLLAMVPSGAMGAYTHWRLGNVVTRVLSGMIPGIMIGAYGGASLAHFLPEATLRLIFAVVLIWMGIRDIRSAGKLRAALASGPQAD
ncbi:MAG: sulfite exporter TauE/SafE family protein [Syntrophales bacterium]|nr:sulfite exporter TauE/SafE family protein [Syntrophales bacterium]